MERTQGLFRVRTLALLVFVGCGVPAGFVFADEGEVHGVEDHGVEAHGVEIHGTEAHGAEVGLGEVFGSVQFWGSVFNFTALVLLLVVFGRKPLSGFLKNRREGVEKSLREAREAKAQAESIHREYSERLSRMDEELKQIREDVIATGEQERKRIVEEAEHKASRMRKDAQFVIAQQAKQIRVELSQETVAAAVAAAEEILKQRMGSSEQDRLSKQYLDQLRGQQWGGSGSVGSGGATS